jgi:spermidine synthase
MQLAQDCLHAETFEREVLNCLSDKIGCDAAWLFFKDTQTGCALALDFPSLVQGLRANPVYGQELFLVKQEALQTRGVAIDTQVLGETRVQQQSYYRDFAQPLGVKHSLLAYPTLRGRVTGGLMLGRKNPFTQREKELVESILPSLAVARASFERLPVPGLSSPLEQPKPTLLDRLTWRGTRVLERLSLPDYDLLVQERGPYREMVALGDNDRLVWSRVLRADPSQSGWPYIELMLMSAVLATKQRRALVIGCGGGVIVRQLAQKYPGISIDLVEREPKVIELALRWFGLNAVPNVNIKVADGVEYLTTNKGSLYDIIIVDAYDTLLLEKRLATIDFFSSLQRALEGGGTLAFNVIGCLGERSLVRTVESLARRVFDDVRLLPVLENNERFSVDTTRNVVLIGIQKPGARAHYAPSFGSLAESISQLRKRLFEKYRNVELDDIVFKICQRLVQSTCIG